MMRTTRMCFVLAACLVCGAFAGREAHRPENYDAFVAVTDYASAREALEQEAYLYFPSSGGEDRTYYEIDNPVVIERDGPLVVHGNMRKVTLVPRNRREPLFVVKRACYVNLERLLIDYNCYPEGITQAVAIRFANEAPIEVDVQLVDVREAAVHIEGPGRFVFQRFSNQMHGLLHAGTLVDHPGAEVYFISAGGNNRGHAPVLRDTEDIYWVWCKRGHVEFYGTFPAGSTRGRADIRIDAPSPRGAHIVAYSRSEGTKRWRHDPEAPGDAVSRILYVPPSEEAVDLALKANTLIAQEAGAGLVDYNAAGTVWLLANQVNVSGRMSAAVPDLEARKNYLVKGDAPNSTLVALGNFLFADEVFGQINASVKFARENYVLSSSYRRTPEQEGARTLRLPDVGVLEAQVPPVPRSDPPLFGSVAVGEEPGRALDLVSVKAFGALGDGETDDTEALQAAFDGETVRRLFFPAGTYVISRPLELRIHSVHGPGGWIAGAGPDRTRIRNVQGGTVVTAIGLAWTHVQGIAFETAGRSAVCFNLDRGAAALTTGAVFSDCHFIGGSVAMGIAVDRGPSCELIFHHRCVFADADVGYAMGNPNALKNMVAQSTFRNNGINMAMRRRRDGEIHSTGQAGCFGILSAEFIGTREKDFHVPQHKMRYFLNVVSDSRILTADEDANSGPDIQLFENCRWNNTADVFYQRGRGVGGPMFLYSSVENGRPDLLPADGYRFAGYLWSRIQGREYELEFARPTAGHQKPAPHHALK